MSEELRRIKVNEGTSVTALRRKAGDGASRVTLAYAPGAGSNINDPFGAYLAEALAGEDFDSWRFEFPYMSVHRRSPDRPSLLESTWRAVLADMRSEGATRVVASGRSMGGRIASQVAAHGEAADGLILFAYPLLPPGRLDAGRTQHLPQIPVPVLFVSGTRDSFGTPEQLRDAVALLPDARLQLLQGADHGFNVLKSSGRSREDVWREALEVTVDFLRQIARKFEQ